MNRFIIGFGIIVLLFFVAQGQIISETTEGRVRLDSLSVILDSTGLGLTQISVKVKQDSVENNTTTLIDPRDTVNTTIRDTVSNPNANFYVDQLFKQKLKQKREQQLGSNGLQKIQKLIADYNKAGRGTIRDLSIRNKKQPSKQSRPPRDLITDADRYYESGKKRTGIRFQEHEIALVFRNNTSDALRQAILDFQGVIIQKRLSKNMLIVESFSKDNAQTVAKHLRSMSEIVSAYPTLKADGGTQVLLSNQIIVKVRSDITAGRIEEILAEYELSFLYEIYGMDKTLVVEMKAMSERDVLDLVTRIDRDTRVEYATPDFMSIDPLPYTPSDNYFSNQWYLDQSSNIDIDASAAWEIARGLKPNSLTEKIKIASLGVGIQRDHPDYLNNIGQGNDVGVASFGLPPLTPPNGRADYVANGSTTEDEKCATHETQAVGTMVSKLDNGGIVGVAPEAEVMPIRWSNAMQNTNPQTNQYYPCSSTGIFNSMKAAAISWAREQGADVIIPGVAEIDHNGWIGYQTTIAAALDSAFSLGRNGHGTVIVGSMGNRPNETKTSDNYPAMDSRVLAVGGFTPNGDQDFTLGTYLDVLGPSASVWTTDFTGGDGRTTTDHVSNFGGTSSAGPIVAGIAALVLSANDTLHYTQVYDIIRQGAEKWRYVPNPGTHPEYSPASHDIRYGYGRANAYNSLLITKNLLNNGNFEVSTDNIGFVPSGWATVGVTGYVALGDGGVTGSTRAAGAGFRSFHVSGSSASGGSAVAVTGQLVAGETYTLTAWFKAPDNHQATMKFENNNMSIQTVGTYDPNGPEWQPLDLVFKMPSAENMEIHLQSGPNSVSGPDWALFDMVTVREGTYIREDIVNGDFDMNGVVGWNLRGLPISTWARGAAPASGYDGNSFAGSNNVAGGVGEMTSQYFKAPSGQYYINFKIAGWDGATGTGKSNQVALIRVSNGDTLCIAEEPLSDTFQDRTWDLTAALANAGVGVGEVLQIVCLDLNPVTEKGWIAVDKFELSTTPLVSPPILVENFADGNDDGWVKHPDGGNWAATNKIYEVASSSGGVKRAYLNKPVSSYIVEGQIKFDANEAKIHYSHANDSGGEPYRIDLMDNNNSFRLVVHGQDYHYDTPIYSNTWYHVKVQVQPTKVKAWLNGLLMHDITVSNFSPNGWIGVGTYNGGGGSNLGDFDNFVVHDLGGSGGGGGGSSVIANGNFETGDLNGWVVNGAGNPWAINNTWPLHNPQYGPQQGLEGSYCAGTFQYEWYTGTMTSQTFTVDKLYLNLRIGGHDGSQNNAGLNKVELRLASDHTLLRSSGTPGTNDLIQYTWDLSNLQNEDVYIACIDNHNGGGHAWISVEDFKLENTAATSPSGGTGGSGGGSPLANGNFESGDLTNWAPSGPWAINNTWPLHNPQYGPQQGLEGSYCAGTNQQESDIGTMTSGNFVINQTYLNFKIGGHDGPQNNAGLNKVELRRASDHALLLSEGTPGTNDLIQKSWNVSNWNNQTVYIACVDNHNGGGHAWISVDDFKLSGNAAKPAIIPMLAVQDENPSFDHFAVKQNIPNPFNPETTIAYTLPQSVDVSLVIYNMLGQPIRHLVQGTKSAGQYQVVWDSTDDLGRSVSSGIYLYRMVAGDFVATRKMLVLK